MRICVLLGRNAELHPQKNSEKTAMENNKMRFMNGKNMEEKWVDKFFLGMGDHSKGITKEEEGKKIEGAAIGRPLYFRI